MIWSKPHLHSLSISSSFGPDGLCLLRKRMPFTFRGPILVRFVWWWWGGCCSFYRSWHKGVEEDRLRMNSKSKGLSAPAAQSQHPLSSEGLLSGPRFCTTGCRLLKAGRWGAAFQERHLAAPRCPHLEVTRATQVHLLENACSCCSHIKSMWTECGRPGRWERDSWHRHGLPASQPPLISVSLSLEQGKS